MTLTRADGSKGSLGRPSSCPAGFCLGLRPEKTESFREHLERIRQSTRFRENLVPNEVEPHPIARFVNSLPQKTLATPSIQTRKSCGPVESSQLILDGRPAGMAMRTDSNRELSPQLSIRIVKQKLEFPTSRENLSRTTQSFEAQVNHEAAPQWKDARRYRTSEFRNHLHNAPNSISQPPKLPRAVDTTPKAHGYCDRPSNPPAVHPDRFSRL